MNNIMKEHDCAAGNMINKEARKDINTEHSKGYIYISIKLSL